MAYQTYITEALVCGTYDSLTADRSFLLFTREGGMLYAYAKSVREERSKQRYGLQECSHIRATLIRGKSGWRLAGIEPLSNLYTVAESREARACIRNTILLLKRVIHGETAHAEIFDDVISMGSRVNEHPQHMLEHILSLRTLHALGYIAPAPSLAQLLHCTFPYERIATMTEEHILMCTDAIEHALTQSQL
jgi:recombinational DNA repair protein (RecF pathway)